MASASLEYLYIAISLGKIAFFLKETLCGAEQSGFILYIHDSIVIIFINGCKDHPESSS